MKADNSDKKKWNPYDRLRAAGRRGLAASLGIGLMLQGLGGVGGGYSCQGTLEPVRASYGA